MSDTIAFSWRLQPGTSLADARALVLDLDKEPTSSAMLLDTGTALFAETAALIISGVSSAAYLASRVQEIVCRGRKPGLIIDARHDPLSITEVANLPGGTVVTITTDGTQQTHNACANGFDLSAVIAGLRA